MANIWNTLLTSLFVLSPALAQEPEDSVTNGWSAFRLAPSYFIANAIHPKTGQRLVTDETVVAFVQTRSGRVLFTPGGAFIGMGVAVGPSDGRGQGLGKAQRGGQVEPVARKTVVLKLGFDDRHARKRPIVPRLEEETGAPFNFFLGARDHWRSGLTTYRTLVYDQVWNGIDVAFSGFMDGLRMRYLLAPNADPTQIVMHTGAETLRVVADGGLSALLEGGSLRLAKPRAYQEIGGRTVMVEIAYRPLDRGRVAFSLGNYDSRFALILGPDLDWSSYLGGPGGEGYESGKGIAIDGSGNAFIIGDTPASDFPTTPGSYDQSWNSGPTDVFVAKLDASGTGLVYGTFLGGSAEEYAYGISIDMNGNAFALGTTKSVDFPATPGAFSQTHSGGPDVFVAKLNASGSDLIYATYLGGAQLDIGNAIAVDALGNAHVTGLTESLDFPTTVGAYNENHNGERDAFVAKLNGDGSAMSFSTFLGSPEYDEGLAIAVDAAGASFISGVTAASTFPTTAGAFDQTFNGDTDAFVVKLSGDGSTMAFSTFLGGSGTDYPNGLVLDTDGNIHLAGQTYSPNFPITAGALDPTLDGSSDVFVAMLSGDAASLLYATFIGGTSIDGANAIALDGSGNAYVTGFTASVDFPTTAGAYNETFNGWLDGFILKVTGAGAGLAYATYFGGSEGEQSIGIAVDAAGNAYVTGSTYSPEFPTTPGALDPTIAGPQDGFVLKLNDTGSALGYATFLGGSHGDYGNAVAVDASGNTYVTGYTFSEGFPTTPGAFSDTHGGEADVFVAKLTPDGTDLAYATFLGGAQSDHGSGIAVDAAGNAYVTGDTNSFVFPTTPGAFDEGFTGREDGFVSKLDAVTGDLVYSTYLGTNREDEARAITVDALGNAYVTGYTNSTVFPTTPGAFDETAHGNGDIFVSKLNSDGSDLVFSTYLGGSGFEIGNAITLDDTGNVYVTGYTQSADFPSTAGAFDETLNGPEDVFVAKLNSTGSGLIYCTYLGGNILDRGEGIAVDAAGSAYVAGSTTGYGFPATPGAFDETHNGSYDAFAAKLSGDGSTLTYATYLGGQAADFAYGLVIDPAGYGFITGYTASADFPTPPSATLDGSHNGSRDVFVTMVNSTGSGLIYSTFLGGAYSDYATGIALDSSGDVHVTGVTFSPGFPVTEGAFDETQSGYGDAFVFKMGSPPCTAPSVSDLPSQPIACSGGDFQFSVQAEGYDPFTYQWYKDAVPLPGETASTLELFNLSSADEGAYFCEVTGPCGVKSSNMATLAVSDELIADILPGSQALGLNPPVFALDLLCAMPAVSTLWTTDPPTALIIGSGFVIMSPPPNQTTLLKATVTDDLETVAVVNAWLLVALNPGFEDFNGDGCNTLQDLWDLAPFWSQPFVGDPDDDGWITVLDFLYINTSDSINCPQ